MSSEPTIQEAEEVEGHSPRTIVLCHGEDSHEDTVTYGPFEDDKWAEAWVKQHGNDPYFGTEDEQDQRIIDEDHWCLNDSFNHEITTIWIPKFDPTTLPVQE